MQFFKRLSGFQLFIYYFYQQGPPPLMLLIFWWIRVISITIFTPDFTVSSLNDKFRFLVLGNFLCYIYRLFLSVSNFSCSFVAFTLDSPLVTMPYNPLIFTHI